MVRKVLFSLFVLAITFSLATAEEFFAVIRKVENGKVTFTKGGGFGFKKKNADSEKKAEEVTLPTATNVKVVKGVFNKEDKKFDAGEAIEGGLQSDRFKNIGEKGVGAFLVTEDGKIKEIRLFGGKGFGKGKKKKDV